MGKALLLLQLLLVVAYVHAAGLTPVSPIDGATVDPASATFSFTTDSTATISRCQLLIENKSVKEYALNDVLARRVTNMKVDLSDGTVIWQIVCSTNDSTISTEPRTVVILNPQVDTEVRVTSSGVQRGSLIHAFAMRNTQEQQPIVIMRVSPGDYLEATLQPGNIKKQLYFKQQSTKDGQPYLWFTDIKTQESYYLNQGENVTINISGSKILLLYKGHEQNKAVIIAYPFLGSTVQQNPPVVQPLQQDIVRVEDIDDEKNQTAPVVEQQKPKNESNQTTPKPDEPPLQAPLQKRGVFQSILSWLSSIFG